MGLMDRLAVREVVPFREAREEGPARDPECRLAEPYEDDPVSSARGTVYGVFLGAIMWGLIFWAVI